MKYLLIIFFSGYVILGFSQQNGLANTGIRLTPVAYHLSFDNDAFFKEDIIEQSGKKTLQERSIDFPSGMFGKGIRMSKIPAPPDVSNMTGIDLDLVTAVIFNTRPGNEMGYNQPFMWGSGRINARLGAVAFWVKGDLALPGPLFEQTSVAFGRKERELLGIVVNKEHQLSAYIRDSRYVRHELQSDVIWNPEQWNHLVLNWDWVNGMELWINGKKTAVSGNQSWFETALPGLFHLPAAGLIYDELYLLDRPINEQEIQALISTNKAPTDTRTDYIRKHADESIAAAISGASLQGNLPAITPNKDYLLKEIWPESVTDGHVPGWYVADGRNEMAWPHPYAMFTIIPGDADFHAEKVDLATSAGATVNYLVTTGNLTNVKVQSQTPREKEFTDLFEVPSGNHFMYGSMINSQTGATFRIPFTERYGTPEGYNGDIHVPLSGEKRIHHVGLYHYAPAADNDNVQTGNKLIIHQMDQSLDKRTLFAIHALTARDERKLAMASDSNPDKGKEQAVNIGLFSRLNILSTPYNHETGIQSVTLSLPIKTVQHEEALFIRVRDPAVPSRMWNQFAVTLTGFDKGFSRLILKIDFQDIVVTEGDRLWIDLGTAGRTLIKLDDKADEAVLYTEEVPSYISIDEYASKEIIPSKVQYAKMYEFMPWQFTGKTVSLENPYGYGGPFDILLPALAVHRVQPDHFEANYMIRMSGPEFKDGQRILPETAPLVTLKNPLHAPEWALYMHDFNRKRHAIIDWWSERQNPDGQLGGGWNDDVMFMSFHQPDLPLDGNENARILFDATQTGLESTNYFKDGYCNVYPMDRMHIGDFISERYNTIINNLGQAYAFERELESAWRLGKPDKTPINYFEDGFKSSASAIKWYWGEDKPLAPYVSKPLDELSKEFRLYTSLLDTFSFFRFTGSNVHRDDFSPYGANTMYTYLLGGARGSRLDAHLEPAVTWPSGGGPDVARVVLYADDHAATIAAYSFDSRKRDLIMRPCRISEGRYRVRIYEDPQGKGEKGDILWEAEWKLSRFDQILFPIPPQKSVVLSLEQIEAGEPVGQLADLALDEWDALYELGQVSCTIHNIGNRSAEQVTVALYDGDKLLEKQSISKLDAPTDLVSKRKELIFKEVSFSPNLRILIDPEHTIKEMLKENNSAFVYRKGIVNRGIALKRQTQIQ